MRHVAIAHPICVARVAARKTTRSGARVRRRVCCPVCWATRASLGSYGEVQQAEPSFSNGSRTRDRSITSRLLYPLSYGVAANRGIEPATSAVLAAVLYLRADSPNTHRFQRHGIRLCDLQRSRTRRDPRARSVVTLSSMNSVWPRGAEWFVPSHVVGYAPALSPADIPSDPPRCSGWLK